MVDRCPVCVTVSGGGFGTKATASPDAGIPDAGAGDGPDAGAGGDLDSGAPLGDGAGGGSDDGSGCGCRAGGRRNLPALGLWCLLALALLCRRRGRLFRRAAASGRAVGAFLLVASLASTARAGQDDVVRPLAEVLATGDAVVAAYADSALAAAGILDVTKAPYAADPSGTRDSTVALQQALKDARDARLVTYLPSGTYRVSSTLECVQGHVDPAGQPNDERRLRDDDFPCVVVGASPAVGPRAVLRLVDGATGFDDVTRPRAVLHLWSRDWASPHGVAPNQGFNLVVRNLQIDVGSGNAGAIGLDLQGAQGTAIDDLVIEVRGGFAGLRGLPGSGGMTRALEIRGGRYGIYAVGGAPFAAAAGSQPVPTVVDVALSGQSTASIHYQGRGPLVLVAARIHGAQVTASGFGDWDGALTILDSIIEVAGAGAAITAGRPVYLREVYLRGAGDLVRVGGSAVVPSSGAAWSHVKELAAVPIAASWPIWLDGAEQAGQVWRGGLDADAPSPELRARHRLAPLPLPWEDPAVANAKTAYGAMGDRTTDDTAALQAAIDQSAKVFLPKGIYRIQAPLRLHADTQLFGVGQAYSAIFADGATPAFTDPANPQPLVDTDDDAAAATIVSSLKIFPRFGGTYALRWRAGQASRYEFVWIKSYPWGGGLVDYPLFTITGNGGGHILSPSSHNTGTLSMGPAYRFLKVDGTQAPLAIYHLNAEHGIGDAQVELAGAANVSVFGFKSETDAILVAEFSPPLQVNASQHFAVYGYGGNATADPGRGLLEVNQCDAFTLANLAHQASNASWYIVDETYQAARVQPPGSTHPVLYRRGAPAPRLPAPQPEGRGLLVAAAEPTPVLDGSDDELWSTVSPAPLRHRVLRGASYLDTAKAELKAAWDTQALYLFVAVTDAVVTPLDAIDVYVDARGDRTASYGLDDVHYTFTWSSPDVVEARGAPVAGVRVVWPERADGYSAEIAIPWATLAVAPVAGDRVGIEVRVQDDDDGTGDADSTIALFDRDDLAAETPLAFGVAELAELSPPIDPEADGGVADGAGDGSPDADDSHGSTAGCDCSLSQGERPLRTFAWLLLAGVMLRRRRRR